MSAEQLRFFAVLDVSKPPYPYPTALVFGVPGAGKGTQGEILTRIPGFFHLSSGVIFRKLDAKSNEGKLVRDYSARGELAPDDVTVKIFLNWLESQRAADRFRPREHLLLLDGLPRTIAQCDILKQYIDVQLILHLVCHDEEAMIERIRRRAVLALRTKADAATAEPPGNGTTFSATVTVRVASSAR